MTSRAVLFAAALSCAAAPVASQTIDGNLLYKACSTGSQADTFAGFCLGYILGVWEGMSYGAFGAYAVANDDANAAVVNAYVSMVLNTCVPSDVENSQIRDVVKLHLEGHPKTRHETARTLIHRALMEAFPCE